MIIIPNNIYTITTNGNVLSIIKNNIPLINGM